MNNTLVDARCHCGAIALEVDCAPTTVTDCNCSICRRYGVLWAYYTPGEVRVTASGGGLQAYAWGQRTIAFQRCRDCGCVTHWAPLDGRDRLGVNARLMPPAVLSAARVRHLDGAGTEEYVDEPDGSQG